MRAARFSVVTAAATAAALTAVTGCAEKSGAEDGAITVVAKDDSCEVSKKRFPAGHVKLNVENRGSKVTEVHILHPDDRIVTERENIGPSTRAAVTAEIKAGAYAIVCRPGMTGEGIRQQVEVTGGAAGPRRSPERDAAVAAYRQYVQRQADTTLPKAKVFTDAVRAGDIEAAKKAYAESRVGWERTEPVAESFGDIGPKVDVREDGLEAGQDPAADWTGWHRLEKALWKDKRIGAAEKALADTLDKDLADWAKRVGRAEITPTSMANGAKELLDEVATGKVTGEEERYSHTDLVDFKANVEGARKSFDLLKPVASKNDPKLVAELDKQFTALNALLDTYRTDKNSYVFTSYDKVGEPEREKLSDAVNALAGPLSKLAAAVAEENRRVR
ncbi:iron uptake system protein EfeO [Streptomyces sp. NPDC002773]|uniref:iron uptake system protein EfeO n=1 Tax=Streptomyces sp. NPDC002773 TaxID=3154430 RepID=UPI00332A831B